MKKYYIDRVTTYSTTINKKSDELACHVYNMYSFSLVDEQSMKHIIDNIHAKAKELDEAFRKKLFSNFISNRYSKSSNMTAI